MQQFKDIPIILLWYSFENVDIESSDGDSEPARCHQNEVLVVSRVYTMNPYKVVCRISRQQTANHPAASWVIADTRRTLQLTVSKIELHKLYCRDWKLEKDSICEMTNHRGQGRGSAMPVHPYLPTRNRPHMWILSAICSLQLWFHTWPDLIYSRTPTKIQNYIFRFKIIFSQKSEIRWCTLPHKLHDLLLVPPLHHITSYYITLHCLHYSL